MSCDKLDAYPYSKILERINTWTGKFSLILNWQFDSQKRWYSAKRHKADVWDKNLGLAVSAPQCYIYIINFFSEITFKLSFNPSLREKCPNTELFLVGIFLYLDWIQENTDQK